MHSIIIPTSNRQELLDKLLFSISQLKISKNLFEVLIVDNFSEPSSKETFQKWKRKISKIKYFHHPKPGLHEVRHRGLKESAYEYLTFLDDDVELNTNFLVGFKQTFADPKVVLIGGPVLPKFESTPPEWLQNWWDKDKVIGHLSLIDLGQKSKFISPFNVFGCNFTIKKKTLVQLGGFHPDGMPQIKIVYRGDGETFVSSEIIRRGLKAFYQANASVYHWVSKDRMTFEYFYKRSFNQGISNSYTHIRTKGIKTTSPISARLTKLTKLLKIYLTNSDEVKIKRLIDYAIYKGYIFHQNQVRDNIELKKWVTQESYL